MLSTVDMNSVGRDSDRGSSTGPLPPPPTDSTLRASEPVPKTPPAQPPPVDDNACLSVVLCPSDDSFWSKLTCVLGFVASFACDGVCASLFLLDARFGMDELRPRPTPHTVEHLAVVLLLRHLIEPFSCAYINWYGFRHCLFVGSVLSIMWITLLCFVENTFLFKHYSLILAIVGGIGMGMIKTSFLVLLSTLFVVNRHTAHFTCHLGSFTGMLIVPPLTEFVMLRNDWHAALYLFFGLMCLTMSFWLLVATPWPYKIQVAKKNPVCIYPPLKPLRSSMTARDLEYLPRKNRFPKIQDVIGEYDELRMEMLTDTTPVFECRKRHETWFYQERPDQKVRVRNVTNMFEKRRMIGCRPMYRDDIFYDGNIIALKSKLNFNEYIDYLMATTRVFTVADLNEEKHKRFCVILPTAMGRVLKSMFDLSIFCDAKFYIFAASEALIHASYLIPFVFIKGPLGQKSSSDAMITLIASCFGLLYGRCTGYWLHKTPSNIVPIYHVSLVLIANGLAILLCDTNDFAKIIPYYGIFGLMFGYYKSIQSTTMYTVFPLKKFNNVYGYISVVRGLSSFFGILIALKVLRTREGSLSTSNENVYFFAGMLMIAGGLCMCPLLQLVSSTRRNDFSLRPVVRRTGTV